MTSNNLYIIPTNTHYRSSVDLLEKILHTNNDAFFYIYQDPDRPDLYYKYLSVLKKNFRRPTSKSGNTMPDVISFWPHRVRANEDFNQNLGNPAYLDSAKRPGCLQ